MQGQQSNQPRQTISDSIVLHRTPKFDVRRVEMGDSGFNFLYQAAGEGRGSKQGFTDTKGGYPKAQSRLDSRPYLYQSFRFLFPLIESLGTVWSSIVLDPRCFWGIVQRRGPEHSRVYKIKEKEFPTPERGSALGGVFRLMMDPRR